MIINGERSLAYIAKITDIKPIENADRIEVAIINDGWEVVIAKKDNFQIGDEVIYIETDAKVPAIPEFEFLKDRKYRIRIIRLRGRYSQGLVIPKDTFETTKDVPLGEDVAKIIGITYYVPGDNERKAASGVDPKAKYRGMGARHPKLAKTFWWRWLMRREWGRRLLFLFFGKKRDVTKTQFPKKFPYISKTDQERVENMPWILEDKSEYIVTQKCDGSSATYILERKPFNRFEFYVCSRNVRMLNDNQDCFFDTNVYWEMAHKYNIEEKLTHLLKTHPSWNYVCWQGEICGPKIQKNIHHLSENHLFMFHMTDSENGRWNIVDAAKIWHDYEMECVPITDEHYILENNLEALKRKADGFYNPSVCEGHEGCRREGLVYYKADDPNFSFKNVSRQYLMKFTEEE